MTSSVLNNPAFHFPRKLELRSATVVDNMTRDKRDVILRKLFLKFLADKKKKETVVVLRGHAWACPVRHATLILACQALKVRRGPDQMASHYQYLLWGRTGTVGVSERAMLCLGLTPPEEKQPPTVDTLR